MGKTKEIFQEIRNKENNQDMFFYKKQKELEEEFINNYKGKKKL